MSTTPTPTIETAVRILNEAFAADPSAIHALCVNHVPCNAALMQDLWVIVNDNPVIMPGGAWNVGMLGVLNGVLEAMTGKRIAMVFEESPPRFTGFRVYEPPQGGQLELNLQ